MIRIEKTRCEVIVCCGKKYRDALVRIWKSANAYTSIALGRSFVEARSEEEARMTTQRSRMIAAFFPAPNSVSEISANEVNVTGTVMFGKLTGVRETT